MAALLAGALSIPLAAKSFVTCGQGRSLTRESESAHNKG